MLFYRIPNADQAMLISGGKSGKDGAPFRVVRGHGAYVFPFFRKASFLTLAMQEAVVQELCYSKQGIELSLRAVMAFKVGTDEVQMVNAGQRFISSQNEMVKRVGQVFAGHLRSIVGSMTVEEIVTERQKLATEVLDGSKEEMNKWGLVVDSFQIETVDDRGQGYIAAMAAPHNAAIQRQAKIAQAQADQAAAEAQQNAVRQQADYARQTAVTEAGYNSEIAKAKADTESAAAVATALAKQKAQVAQATADAEIGRAQATRDQAVRVAAAEAQAKINRAEAEAGQAGPLAAAQAAREVTEAQTQLAEQSVSLREQELERDVIKPAEAAKAKRIAEAEADAQATTLAATAAAAEGRISLDQLLIEQLPTLARAIADGLNGANLTILNGTDGLSEVATGIVAQVGTLFQVAQNAARAAGNGHVEETELITTKVKA